MSKKALQFNYIILNKKEFHKSKEPIDLLSANLDQIVKLINLNIITKSLSILLVTIKVKLLYHHPLFYLK